MDVCEAILKGKVLAFSRNPIAVAGQIVTILQCVKTREKGNLQAQWEKFAQMYDKKLHNKQPNAPVCLYSSKLLSGQTVAEMLLSSKNPALQALLGLRKQVKRTWKGPYKVTLFPSTVLLRLLFPSIGRNQVSYWSFRHFLQSPKCRFYLCIWGNLLSTVVIQMSIQAKLPALRTYVNQGSIEGHYMTIDTYDIIILAAICYSLSDCGFVLCRMLSCYLSSKRFPHNDLSLYLSLTTSGFGLWYLSVSSWVKAQAGLSQLSNVGVSLACWVVFSSLGIMNCNPHPALRVTGLFGTLTNSIVRVVGQSLSFVVLLFLFAYAYASHFMLVNQLVSVWAKNIWHSLYYAFITMLGNMPLDVALINSNYSIALLTVLFVLITNVIMLNFFITVLSRIYRDSREIGKMDRMLLEDQYSGQIRGNEQFAWLNYAIPPFSLVTLAVLPLALAFPRLKVWFSYWLVMLVYCFTLFPIGLGLNFAYNCVLCFPCFLLSYPICDKLLHSQGKIQSLSPDIVPIPSSPRAFRPYFLWTVCGLPKLLKMLLIDLKHTAKDLLTRPNSSDGEEKTTEMTDLDSSDRQKGETAGFEGESEGLYLAELHSGSLHLSASAYTKQSLQERSQMRPEIVRKCLFALNCPCLRARLSTLRSRLTALRPSSSS